MNDLIEIWKDVVGHEGLYQVSNLGSVKSLLGKKPKILKQAFVGKYMGVGLSKNRKNIHHYVHRLVAKAFLDYCVSQSRELVVDHINNNPTDNRLENLQILTNRENILKRSKIGSSKYPGVGFNKASNVWRAYIQVDKIKIYLGPFKEETAAAEAYQKAFQEYKDGKDMKALYPVHKIMKRFSERVSKEIVSEG